MAITEVAVRGERMAATDGTLVNGVLDGDQAAFAELYDRRARLIRAICFDVTHDLDAAADLTQEVFCPMPSQRSIDPRMRVVRGGDGRNAIHLP